MQVGGETGGPHRPELGRTKDTYAHPVRKNLLSNDRLTLGNCMRMSSNAETK